MSSEGRRIAEYDQATGALIREYVWMGWDPIAVVEGAVVYLVRALDHIGRPAFATTLAGTKVWSATWLPNRITTHALQTPRIETHPAPDEPHSGHAHDEVAIRHVMLPLN